MHPAHDIPRFTPKRSRLEGRVLQSNSKARLTTGMIPRIFQRQGSSHNHLSLVLISFPTALRWANMLSSAYLIKSPTFMVMVKLSSVWAWCVSVSRWTSMTLSKVMELCTVQFHTLSHRTDRIEFIWLPAVVNDLTYVKHSILDLIASASFINVSYYHSHNCSYTLQYPMTPWLQLHGHLGIS